ncbi:hypothetical protein Psch_00964 [Pelotomaculum schinkii]|uniref:Phosphoesterase n=1 Tax=Pelotomaculum schinkii TaxID=78350 RepID=A0A4Y7RF62_9FIRM|nr:hypothetical protein Psch_00964 [Pelotomaculum schinkii]
MRVIVFSDSHGHLANGIRALKEAGPLDLIIHAGDFYQDALRLAAETALPVKAVRGNCDFPDERQLEEVFELAGHRVLLLHGHTFVSKYRVDKLVLQALEAGADIVVFGHSHTAGFTREAGVLLFNPGSISRPRDHDRPSYGILEFDEDGVRPAIYRV